MKSFLRDRAGSIAPLFAVAAIPLTIAVGSAVDVGRAMDTRSQLQDISDSAALAGATQFTATSDSSGVTTAVKFVTAAIPTLPGAPTAQVTASCATPTAGAVGVIVANVCDLGQTTSGTQVTAQIKVMLAGNVATTFAALVTPTISESATSTASANVGRNVVFTLSKYNSSASDTDQIYYYSIPNSSIPTSTATNSTTNAALVTYYTWTPWSSSPPASNLVLSNASGFTNPSVGGTVTVQIPLNTTLGFALSNTTGTSNCYGQSLKTTKIYYSHREDANGSYWDMNAPSFNACTSSSNTKAITNYNSYKTTDKYGNVLLMPCNYRSTSCPNSASYSTGSYVYYTDVSGTYKSTTGLTNVAYSRNPLKFVANSSGVVNTDCTKGDVAYEWDDNGGDPDDNDYNDDDFTVNCTTTGSDKSSIKLVN